MVTSGFVWFVAIVLLHTGPVLSQLLSPQNPGQVLSPEYGTSDFSQFILPVLMLLLVLASLPLLVGSSWIFLRDGDNNNKQLPNFTAETTTVDQRIPRTPRPPPGEDGGGEPDVPPA